MNFVKIFHFTNNLVLGTNFRIWLLILSYICTTSYDGCTICVHCVPGVKVWVGGQLGIMVDSRSTAGLTFTRSKFWKKRARRGMPGQNRETQRAISLVKICRNCDFSRV